MDYTSDVIIVGGGIIGCALADTLAAQGLEVTLLERGLIGREASWAAAGMLAPQSEMAEPGPYMDFCLAARREYPEAVERVRSKTGIDPQYRTEGMLYLAFTAEEEKAIRDRAAWQAPLGLGVRTLTREEATALEPRITSNFLAAVHFQEDHQLDPRLMTRGYAIAARLGGAKLIECAPVTKLLVQGDRAIGVETPQAKFEAEWIILAGGAWSGQTAGLVDPMPTYPVKGQMLLLQAREPMFEHTLHSARIYLVPRRDGRIVVGSTEEHEAGFDKTVQAGAMKRLMESAFEIVPELAAAEIADMWAGLRPGTPDRLPILGPSSLDHLFFATGHFRNGVLLAPLTARLIARYILSGELAQELLPYSPSRFFSSRAISPLSIENR